MATPDFQRSSKVPPTQSRREFYHSIRCLDILIREAKFKSEKLLKRAVPASEGYSDSVFNSALELVLTNKRSLVFTALKRVNCVQRAFPDCKEPIEVFVCDSKALVAHRVADIVSRICEKRGLKVVVSKRRGWRTLLSVSVITARSNPSKETSLATSLFNRFKFVLFGGNELRSYDSQMTVASVNPLSDRWLKLPHSTFSVYTQLCGFLGTWTALLTPVLALEGNAALWPVVGVSIGLLAASRVFAGICNWAARKRIDDRLLNVANY